MLPGVLDVCSDARRDGVGPADPLKRGRDLTVVQAGVITAVAADDLVPVGVAAFRRPFHDASRPPSQHHRPAWPGLALVIHIGGLLDQEGRRSRPSESAAEGKYLRRWNQESAYQRSGLNKPPDIWLHVRLA